MKKTPLQEVKDQFGNKGALVKAVAAITDRQEGMTEAEQAALLESVSNKKLLHLHRVHTELKERFGTRERLVDAICTLKFREKKVDADYRSKLLKASAASLLDRHRALSRH